MAAVWYPNNDRDYWNRLERQRQAEQARQAAEAQRQAKIKEIYQILQVRILGHCGYVSVIFASGRNVAIIGTLALIFASPKS